MSGNYYTIVVAVDCEAGTITVADVACTPYHFIEELGSGEEVGRHIIHFKNPEDARRFSCGVSWSMPKDFRDW